MKIRDIKINGLVNPVGFAMETPVLSYKVDETESKRATQVELCVTTEVGEEIYRKSPADFSQKGVELPVDLEPRTGYKVKLRVVGDAGDAAEAETFFETGKREEGWLGKWISPQKQDAQGTIHPILRRVIEIKKKVKKARLYATGVGVFEAYINGEKLGEEYLAPFQSHYETYLQVLTFPVDSLKVGENTWEFLLGKGWYMGTFGLEGQKENYGNRMAAIGELVVTYEDGETETFATDEKFTYCASHIQDSGIYFGEVIDRTKGVAILHSEPAEVFPVQHSEEGSSSFEEKNVEVLEHPEQETGTENLNYEHLKDRISPPLKAQEIIQVQKVLQTPAGETVLDFGQNFAGIPKFTAEFPAGTKVVFDFGEILQEGNFYRGNYREAESQFVYIANGKKEVVTPHFTYFGFRYIKVTGWPGTLKKEDVVGLALYSDMEETGFLHTGNAKIDRLISNTKWGLKSNFMDLPTDCPQRNERLGWTGDAQVFSPTACYHMDTRAFYRKFTKDLRAEQVMLDGAVPNYIPNIGHKDDAGSVWGDVGTFLPYTVYQMFGDKKQLQKDYPLMKDWVDWITKKDQERGERNLFDFGFQFGDWLALDGVSESSFKGSTEDAYVGSMYYARSAEIVAETAEILGDVETAKTYRALYEKIKQAILDEYFTANGRLAADTQASYIIALKFGIYRDRDRVLQQFKDRLKKDGYKIRCGFVGAPLLCTVLAECGEMKTAYDFLLNEEFPSWLYCVNLGATTVWERWNSVMPDGTISDTGMNSLNHYAYGSVMEFVYGYVAGIRPKTPGFEQAILAPHPDARLPKMEASYDSVSGKYVCNTEIQEDGKLRVVLEIPFGCSAEVTLPDTEQAPFVLESGTYEYLYQPTKNYLHPYGAESRLEELAKNPNTLELLFRFVPPYGGMAAGHNAEFQYNTLAEMREKPFIPCDEEAYQTLLEKLAEITV